MTPSARQLIEGIVRSLDERVAPVVDDRWAQSTLRSVRCLLLHLAERVEVEGPLLAEENADLRSTLARIREVFGKGPCSSAAQSLCEGLARHQPSVAACPSVADLTRENESLKRLLDQVLELRSDAGTGVAPDAAAAAIAEAHACIERSLARELPLFQPAFAGRLF